MSEHTPGPWEVVTNNRTRTLLIRPAGGMELIASRTFAGDPGSPVRARVEANARLIAAAPDLLAAAEAFYHSVAEAIGYPADDPYAPISNGRSKQAALRDAIAQARGCLS